MGEKWILFIVAVVLLMIPIAVAAQGPEPLVNDAVTLPDFGSTDQKTSEMMLGKVAVGIVLFESDGSLDEPTEDWTAEEIALVHSEIEAAGVWWVEREPEANLSFVFEWHLEETSYEPISHDHGDQGLWINEVMNRWGYNDFGYITNVRNYNVDLLERYGADRAFTIFVVDSSNDPDHRFSDGYFAFAFLGGPSMTMTSGNDGYGSGQMDMVAAHEIGHVFRALDQIGMPCWWTSGCVSVPNRNSDVPPGCVSPEPSIMKFAPAAWWSGSVDPWARGQVGWWDENCNHIFDCVDPDVETDYCFYVRCPLILKAYQP